MTKAVNPMDAMLIAIADYLRSQRIDPREWHTINLTMKVTPTHRLLDEIHITDSTGRVRQSISPMPGHVDPTIRWVLPRTEAYRAVLHGSRIAAGGSWSRFSIQVFRTASSLIEPGGSAGAGSQCVGRSTISVEMCASHRPRTARPCASRPVPDRTAAAPNHPWRGALDRERAESEHRGQDRLFCSLLLPQLAAFPHRCRICRPGGFLKHSAVFPSCLLF